MLRFALLFSLLLVMACQPVIVGVTRPAGPSAEPATGDPSRPASPTSPPTTLAGLPLELVMPIGANLELSPRLQQANGQTAPATSVTWTSSAETVVRIAGNTLHAIGVGTATVTATSSGATATVTVTVLPSRTSGSSRDEPTPNRPTIALNLAHLTFTALGDEVALTATVTDFTGTVDWESSQPSVAVASTGATTAQVRAAHGGSATVTAIIRVNGVEQARASLTVTVSQQVHRVQVSPTLLLLSGPGASATFRATALDANGHPVEHPLTWSWISSDATGQDIALTPDALDGSKAVVTAKAASAGAIVNPTWTYTIAARAEGLTSPQQDNLKLDYAVAGDVPVFVILPP